MKTYELLSTFLETQQSDIISLSFSDIERIIETDLPPSAFQYNQWWSNDSSPGRQSYAWMSIGWRTRDVSLSKERLTFFKLRSETIQIKEETLKSTHGLLNISPADQQYWWVNHKQSHKYELSKGLLWSPQKKSNGSKSHFYDNMRKAKPGDFILSMANAKIGAVGVIQDLAVPAPIPIAYNTESNIWANIGWLLPVSWAILSNPVKVKNHIEIIREYLPKKYSPIQVKTGNGNQGAYLSAISESLFQSIIDLSDQTIENLSIQHPSMPVEKFDDQLANHDKTLENLSETEKEQVTKSRRGQGIFKENVCNRMTECPITGVSDLRFLIASHIKPWRVCDTAHDRLSGDNGLLLARHVDHLFDKGFISFTDEGEVLKSASLNRITVDHLGLSDKLNEAILKLNSKQKVFMKYHRENIFIE